MSSIKDGMGFEEVTHDPNLLTSSQDAYFDQVSGANFAATGSFVGTSVNVSNVQAANVYGNSSISGATVKADYISGGQIRINDEGILHSTSIGSPTSVYGAKIQAGSGALSAGSDGWIVFPTAYTGVPTVNVSNRTNLAYMQVVAGSINAGSAYLLGATASDAFSWVSVGI